jgi:hypothetical protein
VVGDTSCGSSPTVIVAFAAVLRPSLSVTVSVAVWVPGSAYVYSQVAPGLEGSDCAPAPP